jgi:integrase
MRIHLTDAIVRKLPVPTRDYTLTKDDDVLGLGMRVTAAGSRAFVLDYTVNGRSRRKTIGDFPNWTVTGARAEARRLRHLVDLGDDPMEADEDARKAPTVAALCDRFTTEHLPRKRASTVRDYSRMIESIREHFGPHAKVAGVTHADCDALHRKISKTSPYSANRTAAVLSKMFSMAIRWGWRETNPAKGIERNPEYGRRRYLSVDELEGLTKALAAHLNRQAADIVRVLALTGARRGEVLGMRWADLDLTQGTWSKLPSSTKQKEHHQVPLSGPVRQLLAGIWNDQTRNGSRSDYVFPGVGTTGHVVELKKDWALLCAAAGIEGLRIHDLRHSFASQLASGGASLPLIGALLGHANPVTTARYAHLFQDPQRAAVEKAGAVIAGLPAIEPVASLPAPRRRKR